MGIFEESQIELKNVDGASAHKGYWYSVSDALIMLITGLLCGQTKVMDIHEWANSKPVRKFLISQFCMNEIMSKSQFYNILAIVDVDAFKLSFARWMQGVLGKAIVGKTIAIDGKAVCGTDKLTKDSSILNVVSAYVAELKMTIGSHECISKPGDLDLMQSKVLNKWPKLTTVGAIHRQFTKDGITSDTWHYYISSRPLTSEKFLHHARMEWSVESMHWLLDVHFAEDKTRIFDMNVQNILNTTRKIALNLMQIYKAKNCKPRTSLSSIMRANLFDTDVLAGFLEFFRGGGELE